MDGEAMALPIFHGIRVDLFGFGVAKLDSVESWASGR